MPQLPVMLAGLMTPADPLLPHLIDESVAAEISASTPTDEPVGSWGLLLIAVAIFAAVFVVLRFIANRKQR